MLKFNSKPISEHSEVPLADHGELEKLVDARYDKLTDSMMGETVLNVPLLKKYTYQQAKEQELACQHFIAIVSPLLIHSHVSAPSSVMVGF